MTKVNKFLSSYSFAILSAFKYLLKNYSEVFVLGQGLWSPWYVGNTMLKLEEEFGRERVIDTPVSEAATTGAAVGASISGMRPIVVHPRMDFMLYAIDPIVNQASKWSYMFGGQANAPLTIRSIINRGGEQGAQHSQSLHNWFAHIPGLRVVMPYSVQDARDLLISSVLCDDPVLFIDDRWLYDEEAIISSDINELDLRSVGPKIERKGEDITIVSSSFSTKLSLEASKNLINKNCSPEIIDLRVINPLKIDLICESVTKTKRLLVVDGGTKTSGLAGEIIASVSEKIDISTFQNSPRRITLPDTPTPTSETQEVEYYPNKEMIIKTCLLMMNS